LPLTPKQRELVARAATLERQQREDDFDVRPAAFVERKQGRLPKNTQRDELERTAAHRAIDLFFDSLPYLRDQLRMVAGFARQSSLTVPHVVTNAVSDPTGVHAVEEADGTPVHVTDVRDHPAREANALIRQGRKLVRNVIDLGNRVTRHVPDQPAAAEWTTCIECGERIADGERKNLTVDGQQRPYHRGKCWQAAYRRR
jgi:hypothetical protein